MRMLGPCKNNPNALGISSRIEQIDVSEKMLQGGIARLDSKATHRETVVASVVVARGDEGTVEVRAVGVVTIVHRTRPIVAVGPEIGARAIVDVAGAHPIKGSDADIVETVCVIS